MNIHIFMLYIRLELLDTRITY